MEQPLATDRTTPLRRLDVPSVDGVRVLADRDVGYADGAEADVLRVLGEVTDLSSTSDELRARARTWPERYHFDPARANFLRALEVPEQASVLEVGCGCGAVTRWLGENAALVDAVEPMPARARAARARTRDLPGVVICCGGLDDVPDEGVYDLVVVVGVLEYVGGGSADPAPYTTFLDGLARRLAPGGRLVLAIENALGVKYLAGAAEDHSGRPWESLEGYAPDAPARTFTRPALLDLFRRAGMDASVHGAFPDYKLPRALLTEAALLRSDRLCADVPRFPSPDWDRPRVRTASEGALWRTLVEAGTAAAHPNSFVVVAGRQGEAAAFELVPADLAAVIVSSDRRERYMSVTRFEGTPGEGTVSRRLLSRRLPSGDGPADGDGPRYLEAVEPLRDGTDLLALLAGSPHDAEALLGSWLQLVDAAGPDGLQVDHVPHNVVVPVEGTATFIDSEWDWPGRVTRDWVLARGIFWTAALLAARTYPSAWPGMTTVGDVADHLAGLVGLGPCWRETLLASESAYQAAVGPAGTRTPEEETAHHREQLQDVLAQPLTGTPLGDRVVQELQRMTELRAHAVHAHQLMEHDRDLVRAERDAMVQERDAVRDQLRDLESERSALRGELDAMRARRVVRVADAAARLRRPR